jgi:spermidine/putrescine transport system permease protein
VKPRRSAVPHPLRHWLGANALRIYGVLAFGYLFAPIAYVTVFSFNDSRRTNLVWNGFTTSNWTDPCREPGLCESVQNSLTVGVLATVIATVLGTLVAFALTRHRFRGGP